MDQRWEGEREGFREREREREGGGDQRWEGERQGLGDRKEASCFGARFGRDSVYNTKAVCTTDEFVNC